MVVISSSLAAEAGRRAARAEAGMTRVPAAFRSVADPAAAVRREEGRAAAVRREEDPAAPAAEGRAARRNPDHPAVRRAVHRPASPRSGPAPVHRKERGRVPAVRAARHSLPAPPTVPVTRRRRPREVHNRRLLVVLNRRPREGHSRRPREGHSQLPRAARNPGPAARPPANRRQTAPRAAPRNRGHPANRLAVLQANRPPAPPVSPSRPAAPAHSPPA